MNIGFKNSNKKSWRWRGPQKAISDGQQPQRNISDMALYKRSQEVAEN